jgi:oxygen-independent coproporphyrinogen-3 oxidase
MMRNEALALIRSKLFYGSADYTKSQPDLFLPHRFKILAPSQVDGFLDRVRESLVEEEILLYVHLPFCFSECLFCNSFPQPVNRAAQDEYLENLLKEIDLVASRGIFSGKKARCIYFGGGTPTSFPSRDIGRILEKLSSCIGFSDSCNITSEAHPDTLLEAKRVAELRAIGINRISIGCQTFDQDILARCNRKNTREHVAGVVHAVQDAEMAINIDMMSGLPGQNMESVEADLAILETIRPDSVEYIRHEIVNPLIVKLYQEHPDLIVSTDTLFAMVCRTQAWMRANGYEQNGSFTNDRQWPYRFYWLKEMPIIAFGSRARSYTPTIFYDKYEEVSSYICIIKKGGLPIGRYADLTKREQMFRSFLLELQLAAGLDINRFQRRFATDPRIIFARMFAELGELGCLLQENGSARLSIYGSYFVEDVCDYIIDAVLTEESDRLQRASHSEGGTSARPAKSGNA